MFFTTKQSEVMNGCCTTHKTNPFSSAWCISSYQQPRTADSHVFLVSGHLTQPHPLVEQRRREATRLQSTYISVDIQHTPEWLPWVQSDQPSSRAHASVGPEFFAPTARFITPERLFKATNVNHRKMSLLLLTFKIKAGEEGALCLS